MNKITLDVKEVAAMVGVSTACVYNMVREGQIPFVRVRKRILFHRDKVEAWLKGEAG
jgi:excisionase family DNA binding protein